MSASLCWLLQKDPDTLLKYIERIQREKEEIRLTSEAEKAILRENIDKLIENTNKITTNTTTNINMQQNIYINNYGNERLDYLNYEKK